MGNSGQPYVIGRGARPEVFVPSTPGTLYRTGSYGGRGSGDTHTTLRIGPATIRRVVAKTDVRNYRKGVRQWTPQAAAWR